MHSKPSLKNKALQYLSRREHSRLELQHKLARHAQEGDDIDALLDFLEGAKLLSTERFSEALVRRRLASHGNSRILAELQSHDLDESVVTQIKAELAESEGDRARAVWEKKFGRSEHVDANAIEPEQRAKQVRFLTQRGFSMEAIRSVFK